MRETSSSKCSRSLYVFFRRSSRDAAAQVGNLRNENCADIEDSEALVMDALEEFGRVVAVTIREFRQSCQLVCLPNERVIRRQPAGDAEALVGAGDVCLAGREETSIARRRRGQRR